MLLEMMKEVVGDDEGGLADNRLEVRDKSVTRREKPGRKEGRFIAHEGIKRS